MADLQEILLPVAEAHDPAELRALISQIHQVTHPDELDDKYAKGMERRDIQATKCGDGYHLTGFLDIIHGAKISAWLKDVSAPEYDGDDRTPAARRVDAFCRLFQRALDLAAQEADQNAADRASESDGTDAGDQTEGGTPDQTDGVDGATPDNGGDADDTGRATLRRPRRADASLLVLADLETLLRLPGAEPATLAGFGPIGDQLLGYLTCTGDVIGLLADGHTTGPVPQANILNVGRTSRLATRAQRYAVLARQDGVCANPGCGATHLEIHHVDWWHRDHGRTDLDNLVGICGRCHHLVHQNRLTIKHDGHGGFTFHRQTGRIIDDHTRITKHCIRQTIANLRHMAMTGDTDPPPRRRARPEGRREQSSARRFDIDWLTPLPGERSPTEDHFLELIGHHPTD